MNKIALFSVLVGLLLITGFGCGQSFIEKQTEKGLERVSGRETDVELDDGKVTIKDESGLIIESDDKGMGLPADFPKDIYIIDGEVKAVIRNQTQQGDLTISISTEKSIKESFEVYKQQLSAQGWEIEEAIIGQDYGEEMGMIVAEKGEKGVLVSITENPENKKGALVMMVSAKK